VAGAPVVTAVERNNVYGGTPMQVDPTDHVSTSSPSIQLEEMSVKKSFGQPKVGSWRINAPKNNTRKLAEMIGHDLDLSRVARANKGPVSNVSSLGKEDQYESLMRDTSLDSRERETELYTTLEISPTEPPELENNIYLDLTATSPTEMPIYENTTNPQIYKVHPK